MQKSVINLYFYYDERTCFVYCLKKDKKEQQEQELIPIKMFVQSIVSKKKKKVRNDMKKQTDILAQPNSVKTAHITAT